MEMEDIRPYVKFGLMIDDNVLNTVVVPAVLNDPINL